MTGQRMSYDSTETYLILFYTNEKYLQIIDFFQTLVQTLSHFVLQLNHYFIFSCLVVIYDSKHVMTNTFHR
jgi:hypothetical protein